MRIFKVCSFLLVSIPLMSFGQAEVAADSAKVAEAKTITTALQGVVTKSQVAVAPEIQAATKQLIPAAESCSATINRANMLCLETTSPALGAFLRENGQLIQGLGMAVRGIADQCSQLNKMLNLTNAALAAFQLACGSAQSMCTSSCTKLSASSAVYQKGVAAALKNTAYNPTQIDEIQAHGANATAAIAEAKTAIAHCASYKVSMMQAMTGTVMAIVSMKTAKKCEDDNSSGNVAQPNVDCKTANSPNYATVNCQCARNELPAAQCQGIALNPSGLGNNNGVNVGGIGGGAEEGLSNPNLGGSGDEATDFGGNASGQSLAGAPVDGSGGGGLGGGGGGNGSGFSQDGVGSGRKLNANVLGGYGGGGGGGGFGGAGPGYGETDAKLKEYGPGGAKDPNRSIASEIAKQVTAEGGRSNWEKVRSRYKDNQRTLLKK